ncbi:RecQ family ATP-dependent DNA helicase [Rhabdothermincola salaria]|uniref:RecQ family ATP-dependent DNA helicase n=1 Tax=Rhabdothermincola salaria TaxID=2903142 RepID=UPI001E2B342D|nr:DEAD/DEAH box helicase [Rhabdothermincola salaria]MCD9622506.1 DEAD/DEAH box helicase [Rhabdothermincola salaria]
MGTTDQARLGDLADAHLDAVIAAMAGPDARPRDDQRTAVRALVADQARVLVVQATGWGKSAVYWAATAALRADGRGPTIVVSPLLALMRDQIDAATRAGLRAATINSGNVDEWDDILEALGAGHLDVLLISPERLANPGFAARTATLLAGAGLIVIDEAHCISDWGFDFRPDYQRISRLLTATDGVPVLATTATANQRVTDDVADQLGAHTLVLRGTLARRSLRLAVIDGLGPLERYAWADRALHTLEGSGIVYVATVAETERLSAYLRHQGHHVAPYSGQLDPAQRAATEDDLRANRVKAVVATSALGMGYDKPDLAFCLHLGSPDSPVAYYQQIGRAGRALDDAAVVLLPAETDERLWEYFATASIPRPDEVAATLAALDDADGPLSVPAIESATGLRRGRIEQLLRVVAVDGAVERVQGGWRATGAGYDHDDAKWDQIRAVRRRESDIMRDYARGRGCLMRFLQDALDDPDPRPCGRCSVCTGELPPPARQLDPADVEQARVFLRGTDVVLVPRKRWPGGVGRKGAIVGPDEGRALAFADTPGWHDELMALGPTGAPYPDAILQGAVDVLSRWKAHWPARPVAIVPVPSRRLTGRITGLAEHLGRVGRLPVLDVLESVGPPPPDDAASKVRVEHLLATMSVRPGARLPDGPLLVVDDTYRSGWTMTVAAVLLREAGATGVLPLVVHQLP